MGLPEQNKQVVWWPMKLEGVNMSFRPAIVSMLLMGWTAGLHAEPFLDGTKLSGLCKYDRNGVSAYIAGFIDRGGLDASMVAHVTKDTPYDKAGKKIAGIIPNLICVPHNVSLEMLSNDLCKAMESYSTEKLQFDASIIIMGTFGEIYSCK